MAQSKYSNLYSIIERSLLSNPYSKRQDFQTKVFNETITLTIMQHLAIKGPKVITMYASDLNHTIQLLMFDKNVQQPQQLSFKTAPFNRAANMYYKKLDEKFFNIWEAYNCNIPQLLNKQSGQYASPYTPQYYMGDIFQQFKQHKVQYDGSFPAALNTKIISISEWKIKIVNISQLGCYAPVLEALKFHITRKKYSQNFKNVNLILYEPKLRKTMETMWQSDLKRSNSSITPVRYASFYFTRMANQSSHTSANVYKLDKEQESLNYSPDSQHFYVPIGKKPEDFLVLREEIGQNYHIDEKRVREQYIERNWKELFTQRKEKQIVVREGELGEHLWSSAEEDDGQPSEAERPQRMVDEDEELEEESEDEDPLRNTYMKYVKQQQQKKIL